MSGITRRLLVPGLMSLGLIGIMLCLGIWQLQRMAWKQDTLIRIDRAEGGPARPLGAVPTPFSKVSVQGILRNAQAAYYGADIQITPAGPKMGARLIVPLDRAEGPPVLVDRGWVPIEQLRPISQPTGPVFVEGFVRPADTASWFSASDDPRARRFYTLDPQTIGAAVGIANVAPFVIVALGQRPPEVYPIPAQRMPRPPNDHLNYAVTWFGLAFILSVIFFMYARNVVRP
ncbi:MAG: SURF1 family protein [Acetobacteraceae bacterium]|nr:SURF1 family protein [Acetobacteraceae bacterium]MSP29327.1 SURF1 family protein [Acetobacteraceae bacterium]